MTHGKTIIRLINLDILQRESEFKLTTEKCKAIFFNFSKI